MKSRQLSAKNIDDGLPPADAKNGTSIAPHHNIYRMEKDFMREAGWYDKYKKKGK